MTCMHLSDVIECRDHMLATLENHSQTDGLVEQHWVFLSCFTCISLLFHSDFPKISQLFLTSQQFLIYFSNVSLLP